MNRYDRRPRWRAAVLRSSALTPNTKLVLTVLLEHMDNAGKVRHPVKDVADALGMRNFRRVSDRITEAHRAGYLVTVTKAVHGRHAEYQATFPSDLKTGSLEARPSDLEMGSLAALPSDLESGSLGNRVTTPGIAGNRVTSISESSQRGTVRNDKRQQGECGWCLSRGCPQCDPTEVA